VKTDEVTEGVIGAAIAVHRALGPGLLESVYELCMAAELDARSINYVRQRQIPVWFRGLQLDAAYRVDFLVEDRVVLEIKSVAGSKTCTSRKSSRTFGCPAARRVC
jgi:GxxExxY protein